MIATGGLLRMNRRQDSLRAKNRAENKRKRKLKKRKKNDVVVVKGKLNLCSAAGLVAAVGIMILMVGISMAVLGYWPSPNHQEYQERRRTGAHRANWMSYSKSPPVSSNWSGSQLTPDREVSLNESLATNSSLLNASPSCGFLCDFLDTYLYSDNLKVFGPLVMGIGIFLFICANAVLHENRDKKTKIINLRDIYSTVIDLHSVRSKEYSPLNGLVNYTQSRSPDGLPGPHGASAMPARCSWPSTGLDDAFRRPSLAGRPRSWSRDIQTFTDTVYSIYRDHSNSGEHTPQPRQWGTTSIVTSSVNAFTLPVIKLNNCEVEESGRTEADARRLDGEVIGDVAICAKDGVNVQAGGSHGPVVADEEIEPSITDPCLPQERHDVSAAIEAGEHRQEESQMQLFPPDPVARAMGSRLSLNSLTDQPRSARRCSLSVSTGRQGDKGRRFSCPRLERSNSKGYIKLADLGGESFDAADTDTSLLVSDQEIEVTTTAETTTAMTAAAAEEVEPQGETVLATPSTSAEP